MAHVLTAAGVAVLPPCAITVNPALVLPVMGAIAAILFVAVRHQPPRMRRLLRLLALVPVGCWLALTLDTWAVPTPCRYPAMEDLQGTLAGRGAHPGVALAGYGLELLVSLTLVTGAFAVRTGYRNADPRAALLGWVRLSLAVIPLLSIPGILTDAATVWAPTRLGNLLVALGGLAATVWVPDLLGRLPAGRARRP